MSSVIVNGGVKPQFQDDQQREYARNGKAASGDVMRKTIALANQVTFAGKPIFNWIADLGTTNANITGIDPLYRQIYTGENYGAIREGARAIYLPDTGTSVAGQGWHVTWTSTSTTSLLHYSGVSGTSYPVGALTSHVLTSAGYGIRELKIGSVTSNGPQLSAGCVYQEPQNEIDPSLLQPISSVYGYAGLANVGPGRNVFGSSTSTTATEVLRNLTHVLVDTYGRRRPQIGWSIPNPGVSSQFVLFATSGQQYRYIHDQSYGSGGLTITESTPGITLPLKYAGSGRNTQVKVGVYVYAAMTGATDTGSLAVANRNSSGTMAGVASTLTNNVTVSGTTFQWYPSLGSDPAYFMGYCGSAAHYDRVVLCARADGVTDQIKIAAYTIYVIPDI